MEVNSSLQLYQPLISMASTSSLVKSSAANQSSAKSKICPPNLATNPRRKSSSPTVESFLVKKLNLPM